MSATCMRILSQEDYHGVGWEMHSAFNNRRAGGRADAVFHGGRAQQLPQAGHQHRLARAALPRHHIQAGRQLNLLFCYQRIVPA